MVILVPKGGVPVTVSAPGAGLSLLDNGVGMAVTLVESGGFPIVLTAGDVPGSTTPVLTSINPTTMPASTQTTLRAIGSSFQSTSRIEIAGTTHNTAFVSATELTATIKKNAGTLPVRVRTGTRYSNAINLTVT